MSTSNSIAQASTRDLITAYLSLGIQYRHSPAWTRALTRGWENLARRAWKWDGARLLMQSTGHPQTLYTVTVDGCECHAGRMAIPCDHMTSWYLCREAERLRVRRARRVERQKVDVLVDELF